MGHYDFFSFGEQRRELETAGFVVQEAARSVYADQAELTSAIK